MSKEMYGHQDEMIAQDIDKSNKEKKNTTPQVPDLYYGPIGGL
jgi:hypothetical protein